jgi:Domain of unknown function (DUF4258)
MVAPLHEPYSPGEAKRLIGRILEAGDVRFSQHALDEMAKDALDTVDCTNVLRGGVVEPGEWENRSWRYHVRTARMCVVVAFRSTTALVVVTAWRLR